MSSDLYAPEPSRRPWLVVGFPLLAVLVGMVAVLFYALKLGLWTPDYKALGESTTVEADLAEYMIEDDLPPQLFQRRLTRHALRLSRAGYERSQAGDFVGALKLRQEALDVRLRIFDVHQTPETRKGLGRGYSSVAYAYSKVGAYQAAADARFEAAEIYAGLPDTLERKRDIANQLYFGAGSLRRLKAYDDAATAFERAIAARQRVLDLVPDAKDDRHGMAILHNDMTIVERARGNHETAMEYAETALADLRSLVEDEPDYDKASKYLRDVLFTAAASARGLGNEQQARAFLDELIENVDNHIANAPSESRARRQRYAAYLDRYLRRQSAQASDAALRAAMVTMISDARFLHTAEPETRLYAEWLAETLVRYGRLTSQDADKSVPDKAYAQAVELAREILAEHPESRRANVALAYGLWYQGSRAIGDRPAYEDFEASLPFYEEATAAIGQLVQLSQREKYKLDQVQLWRQLGLAYLELGDDAEAFKAFRQTFQFGRAVTNADPDNEDLYRRNYRLAFDMSSLPFDIDEKLGWERRAQDLLAEAKAAGRLHPDDANLPEAIERRIAATEVQKAERDASH